jgi:hypothetical protein
MVAKGGLIASMIEAADARRITVAFATKALVRGKDNPDWRSGKGRAGRVALAPLWHLLRIILERPLLGLGGGGGSVSSGGRPERVKPLW